MANTLGNRVKMSVSGTPGTGTITLGSAVSGFQTFAQANIPNAATVPYVIEDGSDWEIGVGTYTSSGTKLARTTVKASSNSGSEISATSAAILMISPLAEDLKASVDLASGTSGGIPYYSSVNALSSSNALAANEIVIGGGAGVSPSTTTTAANILTFIGTPSSANLASAVTDDTGSGALVFGTSPTITTPTITFSTSATIIAGTNAQGQGVLTSDYNVITTAASNPSGVTLPTATVGRRVAVVNRGANAVNVYPATGGTIDGLSANSSIQIPANNMLTFIAPSTTQWYSTALSNMAGTVPVAHGGTGLTSLTAGYIPFGAGTGAFGNSANLFWDNTNGRFGIGTSSPKQPLTFINGYTTYYLAGVADQKYIDTNFDGTNYDFRHINDAYTAANTAYRISRSGYTTSSHIWYVGSTSEAMRIDGSGNVLVTGAGGLGYGTGSGGAVTQGTSRTTGVTLNKTNGAITLVSAAGTTTWQTFTVTNSTVAATDTVIVSQKSGTDLNEIHVTNVAAGSFKISFKTTGGTTTEQPVFNFAVLKAVAA